MALASVITWSGVMRLPFTATQRPASNWSSTSSIASGASAGHLPISGSTMSIDVSTLSRSSAPLVATAGAGLGCRPCMAFLSSRICEITSQLVPGGLLQRSCKILAR